MTHPPQGQDPQPSDEPGAPQGPRSSRVPSPYEGTPASFGQPTPTSDPSRPIYRAGAPSASSSSSDATSTEDAAPAYGAPAYAAPAHGAPAAPAYGAPAAPAYGAPAAPAYGAPAAPGAHSVPSPYAGGTAPRAVGQQSMTWRTILAYALSPIALLFIPISGVLAIVLAWLGVRNHERTSRVALGVAIACTVLGLMLGMLAQSQVA